MAKPKKKAQRREIHISPERAAMLRRAAIHLAIACAFFGALGAGFYYVKQYVDREVVVPTDPPTIVIKNRPQWMSDFLVQRIAATARPAGRHSAYDHDMLVQARKALEANPWVSKVYEVRRAYRERPGDTLEIDCEYRVPVALVKWGLYYWLVDANGYKLPEAYEPADVPKIVVENGGRIDIRIIEGVRKPPPEKPGQKWVGDDLAAGLEMARLLFDKPYAGEIRIVNVKNFGNPREPHVVLVTKRATEVRWGRTPSELDREPFMEISTGQKLDRLAKLYTQYGRLDGGHSWLDIRFDQSVTFPGAEAGGTRTASGG
jgi:hypothetical protein